MSNATVPAYHVYQASMAVMKQLTDTMKVRNEMLGQILPKWWQWSKRRAKRDMLLAFQNEHGHGVALGRLIQLSVAATSVSPTATLLIDEFDPELIKESFFHPALVQSVRKAIAFASAPSGNA